MDTISYEEAKKATDEGKPVEWYSTWDKKWYDIEPGTSALVMARDFGAKLRLKGQEETDDVPLSEMPEFNDLLTEYDARKDDPDDLDYQRDIDEGFTNWDQDNINGSLSDLR